MASLRGLNEGKNSAGGGAMYSINHKCGRHMLDHTRWGCSHVNKCGRRVFDHKHWCRRRSGRGAGRGKRRVNRSCRGISLDLVRTTCCSKCVDAVTNARTELVRRNHGDVSREVVGTIEQNKLLGLGTINNVAFLQCMGSLAKTLPEAEFHEEGPHASQR